jgi:repressor of nif and glnA expression
MDTEGRKKLIFILKVLQNSNKAMSSKKIAGQLASYGYFLPERTIRHYLKICDENGFTQKADSRATRIITQKGIDEISNSFVLEKVGIMSTKINNLSYEMDFSIKKKKGTVILNMSLLDKKTFHKHKSEIRKVFDNNLGMGNYVFFVDNLSQFPEFSHMETKNKIALGTICSITLNGILLRLNIYVNSVFGGLLELKNHQPYRFTQIIRYDGTSLDPIEIFLRGRMTSVNEYLLTGNGKIAASFREIPAVAYFEVLKLKKILEKIGLNGILVLGKPGSPLCGISVKEGMVGMIVVGGLNPFAPLVEKNIEVANYALHNLINFEELIMYNQIL